jgi:GNAT superfamily N-acetyltransferase
MQQRLTDYSPSLLISAIEDSMREFWINWGQAPQCELYDQRGILRLYTGIPYAFCNAVICSQSSPEEVDEKIDETVAYYAARNATWEWVVGPGSNPASLDQCLEQHGLACRGEAIGMAIDLHAMPREKSSARDVMIKQAQDEEILKLWATTMIEGFESPFLYPSFVDLECSLGCHQAAYRRYLGFLDERPVSTCALYLGEKVAGIYCVSTLPSARRLGVGAAITRYALDEALADGYHVAVLQSSSMGRSVYRGLGFQGFSSLRMYSLGK